jgi:hypothetical protein
MFVRQSLIRGGTATHEQVVEGLAAWVTVLFDLDDLQIDRRRALGVGWFGWSAWRSVPSQRWSCSPFRDAPHSLRRRLFGRHPLLIILCVARARTR